MLKEIDGPRVDELMLHLLTNTLQPRSRVFTSHVSIIVENLFSFSGLLVVVDANGLSVLH